MESGENWSSSFRGEDIQRLQDFIHVYNTEQENTQEIKL